MKTMPFAIKYVSEVAGALKRAKSEWKRSVDTAVVFYRSWSKFHPDSSKWDWLVYSGNLGADTAASEHVWKNKGKTNYSVPDGLTPDSAPYEKRTDGRKERRRNRRMNIGTPYQHGLKKR
jgi:hypothetical protein